MAILQEPACELTVGDRAPNFVLPAADGRFVMFYDQTKGRQPVLLLTPGRGAPGARAVLRAFADAAPQFAARGLILFCVSCDSVADNAALAYPFLIWSDPEKAVSRAYHKNLGLSLGAEAPGDSVVAVLMDANQRLLAVRSGAAAVLASQVLEFYQAQPAPDATEVRGANAPVLLLPRVLDRAACRALIELWHTAGHAEGTVGLVTAGQAHDVVAHAAKKRLDHRILDPELNRVLQRTVGRRIAPEIQKAFHFQGFRFDRFLVVCYDAARGDYFKPHRDNTGPETADRRFAITLNLNSEEYDGGALVFPEYGGHGYRPETGGAVIFSCSLIHAALTPTRGRRFALLSFLRSLPQTPAARA